MSEELMSVFARGLQFADFQIYICETCARVLHEKRNLVTSLENSSLFQPIAGSLSFIKVFANAILCVLDCRPVEEVSAQEELVQAGFGRSVRVCAARKIIFTSRVA